MLLLWLSIVCMIPFDLSRFDDSQGQDDDSKGMMNRILRLTAPYLYVNDKCQDAAAYLLAKFVSRADVCKKVLPKFYENLLETTFVAKSILCTERVLSRSLMSFYVSCVFREPRGFQAFGHFQMHRGHFEVRQTGRPFELR